MINIKKNLYVFGGFHDNLRDYKYFNDIYCFNMATRTWSKLETSGIFLLKSISFFYKQIQSF